MLKERLANAEKRSHKNKKEKHRLREQIRLLQVEKERKDQFTFREPPKVASTDIPHSSRSASDYPAITRHNNIPIPQTSRPIAQHV